MLTKDTLVFGEEARRRLIQGIYKCKNAVGSTMGTGGANSILETLESPNHRLTNDGATILEAIRLADPIEEMGRRILLEAVSRSNKASGDGSSTTTVLTAAILEEGQKHISEQSPMDIKRDLEACIPIIEKALNEQKRDVEIKDVGSVAAISAEDAGIGAKIQEIYENIGKDGIIYWDISKTTEDTYTIGQGITVDGASYLSPYMCDADDKGANTGMARLKNPKILLLKQKVTSAEEFNTLAAKLHAEGLRDLVVFADEIDPLVVPSLVMTRMQRGFRILVIKMPVLWKDIWYADLAKATGATVIDPSAGLALKDASSDHLGTVAHLVVTKDETNLDGIADVSEHITALRAEDTEESALRVARLNTKTARYFVGGISDSAVSHRRFKVEDAIAAAHHALNGGIVLGGGYPLDQIADTIPNAILKVALKAPYEQIAQNMNKPIYPEDLEAQKVYDPYTIVLNSAKNAISVAANILTANTLVLLPREEQQ